MTILFNSNIRNLLIGRGLLDALAGSGGSSNPGNGIATVSVTVFTGAQPSAANIAANWSSYNTTYLAHWAGVQYNQPLYDVPGTGVMLTMYSSPPPTVAFGTGGATWGIIWTTNLPESSIQGAVLPNANFIVGNVSLGSGTGVIRLADLNIVAATSVSLLDSSITAS